MPFLSSLHEFEAFTSTDAMTVIYFSKSRCRRCRALGPAIKTLARKGEALGQDFRQVVVDGAESRALCRSKDIWKVPSIQVYRAGVVVGTVECGPRGTGAVRAAHDLWQDIQRYAEEALDDLNDMDTGRAHPDPGAEFVMAALPVSLIAVLSSTAQRIAADHLS